MNNVCEPEWERLQDNMGPEPEEYDDCANCGGEGYIYCCQDEIGCVDPDGGCDLCMRRCDWCNPGKTPRTRPPVGTGKVP